MLNNEQLITMNNNAVKYYAIGIVGIVLCVRFAQDNSKKYFCIKVVIGKKGSYLQDL